METDIIYNEDCLEGLSKIPDKSIDLIVTDPPYNMGKDFENDNLKKQEYLEWYEKWIDEALRVLRENGSIYIFQSHHLISEIKLLLDSKGLTYRNWITWVFSQGIGASKNFSYRHEDILFYSKPFNSSKFIEFLNQARLKKGLSLSDINKHFGMATNGGGCASQWMGDKKDNTLPTKEQFIELKKLLDLKDDFDEWFFERRKGFVFNFDDVAERPVRKDKNIRLSGKNPSNVWKFDSLVWNHPERVKHPTQKPLNLIKRMILVSSNKRDIILDPFMGSGTTALACKELNRRYIGFEKDPEYCKIISKTTYRDLFILRLTPTLKGHLIRI